MLDVRRIGLVLAGTLRGASARGVVVSGVSSLMAIRWPTWPTDASMRAPEMEALRESHWGTR